MKNIYAFTALNHLLIADQVNSEFNVRLAKNGLTKNAHQAHYSLFVKTVLHTTLIKKTLSIFKNTYFIVS